MMSLKSSFNQEDSLNGSPKMQIIRKRPKPHTSQSRAIKKLFSFEHFDCICIWLFKTNKIKKQTNVMWDSSSNWRHRSKIVTQIKYMLIPFNIIWMLKVQTIFQKHIFKGNFKDADLKINLNKGLCFVWSCFLRNVGQVKDECKIYIYVAGIF